MLEHLTTIGMSQAEFARRIEVSDSYISQVINGKARLSLEKAKMSADVIGCYMDDLYEWVLVPSKSKRRE